MRHGFSDDSGNGIDISAADLVAFVNQDVARLAEMLQPQWLEDNRRRSPANWLANSKFELAQALECARFSVKSVDDAVYESARPVIRAAKALLAQLEAQ